MGRRVIIVVVVVLVLFAVIAGIKVYPDPRDDRAGGEKRRAGADGHHHGCGILRLAAGDHRGRQRARGARRGHHDRGRRPRPQRQLPLRRGCERAARCWYSSMPMRTSRTLHSLEAAADLAATVYARDKVQFDAQAISQAQLDADAADLQNKRAQAAAQAARWRRRSLRAPFAGRLGITTVNPGQYLNTGDKVVTLQALDPVYVDFRLPQQQLRAGARRASMVRLSARRVPRRELHRQSQRDRSAASIRRAATSRPRRPSPTRRICLCPACSCASRCCPATCSTI